MTSKAAICLALIKGHVLNIKNGFHLFGVTNIPREIGRSVERSFDVKVTRIPREGKSRYGQACIWFDYSLDPTEENAAGIKKMIDYVRVQRKEMPAPKTDKQKKEYRATDKAMKYLEQTVGSPKQLKIYDNEEVSQKESQ